MPDQDELATLVAEIAGPVRDGGHTDRADWLVDRLVALRDPSLSPAELADILGMRGLHDLELTGGPSSSEASGSARVRLDDLADRLHDATR